MLVILVLSCVLSLQALAAGLECHPQGPVVPRPRKLSQSKHMQDALASLKETIDAAVQGTLRSGWDVRNVSISIGLVTLDQEQPSIPFWEYHHLATGNTNGTQNLDRNSQYMIGSISKVVTEAILLRSGLDMDDLITRYIPSLNDATSSILWSSVSIGALASQLSGMPPNCKWQAIIHHWVLALALETPAVNADDADGFSEYYYLKDSFEFLGLPRLNDSAFGPCGVLGLNNGCTKERKPRLPSACLAVL
jgi:CubicO group peptidase (beta-lactamase class C family)